MYTDKPNEDNYYPARICTKEETSNHLLDTDLLLVCGPYEKLQLMGDFVTRPRKTVGFQILPNYKGNTPKIQIDTQIDNFTIQRF